MAQTSGQPAHLALPVTERDHALGLPGAPLTLVEYGDFECPFCGMAYPEIKEIRRRLGKQLRLVYRHFPISSIHPLAAVSPFFSSLDLGLGAEAEPRPSFTDDIDEASAE